MDLFINPYIFFLIQESKIILWDYNAHVQYELTDHEFFLLKNYKKDLSKDDLEIIQNFINYGILSYTSYEDIGWKWDELSKIFLSEQEMLFH